MPNPSPKRGAIASPRHALAAATPYLAPIGAPPYFIMKPQKISMWGNDVHGDCVTAEEAFAKACYTPEIFISDADAIAWATRHGVLEGAYLAQVMAWMQSDGFLEGSFIYCDGPFLSVNWTNTGTLQSAICVGPVKLGVAADQIETAWHTTGGHSGWFGTGFHADGNEDHCVSLCGYGPISWLAQQLGVQVPAGVAGAQLGYAMFTWNSIGIIDVPSLANVTHEAWLRQPTTKAVPVPVGWQAAFQANTGNLWIVGKDNRGDMGLGMLKATSPSIAVLPNGGWQAAFQANTGNLWVVGTVANPGDMHLGMLTGTSPSIAGTPDNHWQAAFQANTGNLWVVGKDNRGDMALGMMKGTSPGIAVLPNGGWQAAFQANTGNLWVVGTVANAGDMHLGMLAGTSPSIAGTPDNHWQAAFQANTGNLWVVGKDNRGDMALGMMKGTSPGIAVLPNGGWQAAFQGKNGNLWVVGTVDNPGDMKLGMMAGTSPVIASVPGGGWQAAFQANTGNLWVVGKDNRGDMALGMLKGTSPGIAK